MECLVKYPEATIPHVIEWVGDTVSMLSDNELGFIAFIVEAFEADKPEATE